MVARQQAGIAGPRTKPGRATRALLENAEQLAGALTAKQDPAETALLRLRARVPPVQDELLLRHLEDVPVERLRELTSGSVRAGTFGKVGIETVADVLKAGHLSWVPGIGEKTAGDVRGAAYQLANLARDGLRFRLDPDGRSAAETDLLRAVARHVQVAEQAPRFTELARMWAHALREPMSRAEPATRGLRFRFSRQSKDDVLAAIARLEELMEHPAPRDIAAKLTELADANDGAFTATELWRDFHKNAARIYAHLDEHTDLDLGGDAEHGALSAEIVEAVRRQVLDLSHVKASLRGYQSFGARYALVQRRALIGDEMGLGKTITALAVAAHLRSTDARHVLVICPASVLHNWQRETVRHTRLPATHLYGPGRAQRLKRWKQHGGVGITTYDTLRTLDGPYPTDMLIADEAHYVKNPNARRTSVLAAWAHEADRVLYLTGTPLENKVEEFRFLISQLQPAIAEELHYDFAFAGSDGFRSKVAPVYLRRNQEDVLAELPERLEAEDWVEMTTADLDVYRRAVASKNFMAMRRAAWERAPHGDCGKMARLADIVEESQAEGWKIVVFSFFLDTIRAISEALDVKVYGPLTGSVPPQKRLQLVDDFSAYRGSAVLVSQITAGGVGLNIQAASVVVLAEPQWKPSLEEQAIARCHRMGQTRRVHVHRLLTEPGVDLRMTQLLAEKATLFDEYARQSSVKDAAEESVDRTEIAMAKQILDEELNRLGFDDDPDLDPVLF